MFSERIKKLREENNISQIDLAEYLGISQQALSKWENGKNEPDNDSLIKIAVLMLEELKNSLAERHIALKFDKSVSKYIVDNADTDNYGNKKARQIV